MDIKHTSGPWVWAPHKQQDNPKKGFIVLDNRYINAKNIATVISCVSMYDEEVLANAKLIAAAPDLLSACETLLQQAEVCNYYEQEGHQLLNNRAIHEIRAAIKKATE